MRRIKKIVDPLFREWPFVLVFLLLMGAKGVVQRIIMPQAFSSIESLPVSYLLSYLGVWLLGAWFWAWVFTKYPRRWLKILVYAILFLFFVVQDFLVHHFGQMINPSYLTLLAETSPGEAKEFTDLFLFSGGTLSTVKRFLVLLGLALVLEFAWGRLRKRVVFPEGLALALAIPLSICLLYGVYSCKIYGRILGMKDEYSLDEHRVPSDPLSRSFYSVRVYLLMGKHFDQAIQTTLSMPPAGWRTEQKQADSLSVILVLGESYSKWHTPLYGYGLNTTPHMLREKEKGNLLVFEDVVSTYNLTSNSLKDMLCANRSSLGEAWYEAPYVPAVFKSAGFEVYFWDNQQTYLGFLPVSISLNSFLYHPDIVAASYSHTNTKTFTHDGDLVKDYLDSVRIESSPSFSLIHLLGQHMDFNERYPGAFSHFTADSISREEPYLDAGKRRLIAEYDNATFYNDAVWEKIMSHYRNRNAVIVYISDHGEEIYDVRDQAYRDHGPLTAEKLQTQYSIPMMVWFSDKYQELYPETVSQARKAVVRPLSGDLLCQVLFHLAGVETPCYQAEYDVLDESYIYPKRLVQGSVDYDMFMKNAKFVQ